MLYVPNIVYKENNVFHRKVLTEIVHGLDYSFILWGETNEREKLLQCARYYLTELYHGDSNIRSIETRGYDIVIKIINIHDIGRFPLSVNDFTVLLKRS